MNSKAQFEDINVVFMLLAILGGMIAFIVATRGSEGKLIPAMSGVITVFVVYFYLEMTDK